MMLSQTAPSDLLSFQGICHRSAGYPQPPNKGQSMLGSTDQCAQTSAC